MRELHVSEITAYNACPRMYKYSYVDNLVPKVNDRKLFLGSGVHKALEAYYSGKDALVAYEEWTKTELEKMAENMTPDDLTQFDEVIAMGRRLVEYYVPWAKANDTFEVVAAEQEFAVPIWAPDGPVKDAAHVGRFDGIARDIYGGLWLMEHKTYTQIPSESALRLDPQAGYYLVAAQQLFPNEEVKGVIYTIIRKVDPNRARGEIVHRYRVLRNGHELERLRHRLYQMYKIITSDTEFIPTPGMHCNWMCRYRQLCIAEEDGSDVGALKDAFYTVREREVLLGEDTEF